MKPIGLTMKHGRNKYRFGNRGELMLVHQCIECGTLSINRIAADDIPSMIVEVFETSLKNPMQGVCQTYGILMLTSNDRNVFYKQLYGTMELQPVS
jgi:hypothetical protein